MVCFVEKNQQEGRENMGFGVTAGSLLLVMQKAVGGEGGGREGGWVVAWHE